MALKRKQTAPTPDETDDMNVYLKLYLNTEFKNVHVSLNRIEEQSKSNESAIQGVIRTMNQMQLVETLHFTECPNTIQVQNIKTTLAEFLFFKKYYRVFLISGAVTVGIMIFGGIRTWEEFSTVNKEKVVLEGKVNELKTDVLNNTGKIITNTTNDKKARSEQNLVNQQNTKK